MTFEAFPKIPRLNREIVITEKIDGTNAAVVIEPRALWVSEDTGEFCESSEMTAVVGDYVLFAQSRTRIITPGKGTDNHGFAAWVRDNAEELLNLGPGRHFGEWWGGSIQRGYGLTEKRFSLFNVGRWVPCNAVERDAVQEFAPACCHVVPVLYRGPMLPRDCDGRFALPATEAAVLRLRDYGSVAAPGFMDPEGIIVFHTASGHLYKVTCKDDEKAKGQR